ncbi:MAG: prepilin peptidase, partial [Pseudomonadota bacterium]
VGAVVGITLMTAFKRGRDVPIPFGPYLAAAGWIAMLWGDSIIGGYTRFAGLS